MKKKFQPYQRPIIVSCPHCKQQFNEEDVEITDIYSDIQERDVVTFVCPGCGKKTESLRRG